MKVRLPIYDARDLSSVIDAAKRVESFFSYTNGGLPKFEQKWSGLSDNDKRQLLSEVKHLAYIVRCLEKAKVKLEVEIVEK